MYILARAEAELNVGVADNFQLLCPGEHSWAVGWISEQCSPLEKRGVLTLGETVLHMLSGIW